jgi:hypothetical protein
MILREQETILVKERKRERESEREGKTIQLRSS